MDHIVLSWWQHYFGNGCMVMDQYSVLCILMQANGPPTNLLLYSTTVYYLSCKKWKTTAGKWVAMCRLKCIFPMNKWKCTYDSRLSCMSVGIEVSSSCMVRNVGLVLETVVRRGRIIHFKETSLRPVLQLLMNCFSYRISLSHNHICMCVKLCDTSAITTCAAAFLVISSHL